jgi:hypothetical protein
MWYLYNNEFYSDTKKEILSLDICHKLKGRLCTEGIGKGKEAKNLNVVDVLTV